MPNYQQLRVDRAVVERAARRLRDLAIRDAYAGAAHKELTFGLASVLDELGRHLRDLDASTRRRVVDSCHALLGLDQDAT